MHTPAGLKCELGEPYWKTHIFCILLCSPVKGHINFTVHVNI